MKSGKFNRLFSSQTPTAKKVYESVPIQIPWNVMDIIREMYRKGINQNLKIVQGCLNHLVDSGLVNVFPNEYYQRVAVEHNTVDTEEIEDQETDMSTKPVKEVQTPFDTLASLALKISQLAKDVQQISTEIENVALIFESEQNKNSNELQKLRQLKELLGSLNT